MIDPETREPLRIGRSRLPASRDDRRECKATSASLRVAMWSGPRNISTAMMRAWENRGDCAISDEPLYAAYLAATAADHPMREEVIAAGETNWRKVVAALLGPVPGGRSIWYQKHMAHHLLPGMGREWIHRLTNVLLIRDPREVVASYLKSRATVTAADIGLPQQAALYDQLAAIGRPPPIIDAGDFLRTPETCLRALCELLHIEFTDRMLHWPSGPRASDGIWAPHWYAHVWKSTGFDRSSVREIRLSGQAAEVADACLPHYCHLHAQRLRV